VKTERLDSSATSFFTLSQSSRIFTSISFNTTNQFTIINSSKSSHLRLLLPFHSSILIASASLKMTEYDAQKFALTLKLNVDNEEVLLQFSLKTEMRSIVADCKETIIVTAVKSVRSEIQQPHYQTAESS